MYFNKFGFAPQQFPNAMPTPLFLQRFLKHVAPCYYLLLEFLIVSYINLKYSHKTIYVIKISALKS